MAVLLLAEVNEGELAMDATAKAVAAAALSLSQSGVATVEPSF